MPEIVADPFSRSCDDLFPTPGIQQLRILGPDPLLLRARNARGRFAKGKSDNPRGTPNPKRRVPDLVARPLSAHALSNLLDRKPHLLRSLAGRLLPLLASIDPAVRLGIDPSPLRRMEDVRQAVSRCEIAPAEAAHITRRVRVRLRAARRLTRLERRLTRKPGPAQST